MDETTETTKEPLQEATPALYDLESLVAVARLSGEAGKSVKVPLGPKDQPVYNPEGYLAEAVPMALLDPKKPTKPTDPEEPTPATDPDGDVPEPTGGSEDVPGPLITPPDPSEGPGT